MPDSKSRKRKRAAAAAATSSTPSKHADNHLATGPARPANDAVDTSKPTAVFKSTGKGRRSTLSIALPGSIIANAQTHDLKTALPGRIARACAVFCVDEVIIFNDGQNFAGAKPPFQTQHGNHHRQHKPAPESQDGYTGYSDPDNFLFHVMSFLECPPYLRKHLFPLHPNLGTAGTLPSLDMPHHLKGYEWARYREGVTVEAPASATTMNGAGQGTKRQKKGTSDDVLRGSYVDAGFATPVFVPGVEIPPSSRVTLRFASETPPSNFQQTPQHKGRSQETFSGHDPSDSLTAEVIHPSVPREDGGFYWGYEVRIVESLSAALDASQSTLLANGDGSSSSYDVVIGTSERGQAIADIMPQSSSPQNGSESTTRTLPSTYKHALMVFGGVAGLEVAAGADSNLQSREGSVGDLFGYWVNVVPGQGSRTIRTEEAVWLALGRLWEWVRAGW